MKIKQKQIILILFSTILLLNCGISNPTESDARVIFEKNYKDDIENGTVKVIKFKKVNGQSSEFAGVKLYSLIYEAEIEYPKGINPECKHGANCFGWAYSYKDIGEKEMKNGEIIFQYTENGWQVLKQ